jgi:predicted aconitase with swiveling domain
MNIVIDTLIAFLGGADPETLTEGIRRAGQEHDLYTLEVARLLGIPQGFTATAGP